MELSAVWQHSGHFTNNTKSVGHMEDFSNAHMYLYASSDRDGDMHFILGGIYGKNWHLSTLLWIKFDAVFSSKKWQSDHSPKVMSTGL